MLVRVALPFLEYDELLSLARFTDRAYVCENQDQSGWSGSVL